MKEVDVRVSSSPTSQDSTQADAAPASFGARAILRVVLGSARAVAKTRLQTSGVPFYLMVWLSFPIFNVLLIALIYRNNPTLQSYAIIAGAGLALLFGMLFNASEILDRERQTGTLGNLFVAPAPRFSWLGGLPAVRDHRVAGDGDAERRDRQGGLRAAAGHRPADAARDHGAVHRLDVGLQHDPGCRGVALRNANQLSNLVFPILQLFAGTLYPIALMPEWIRVPARCLPFGYGIQAMVDSVTRAPRCPTCRATCGRSRGSPWCCRCSASPPSGPSSAVPASAARWSWSDSPAPMPRLQSLACAAGPTVPPKSQRLAGPGVGPEPVQATSPASTCLCRTAARSGRRVTNRCRRSGSTR